ncbi:plasma membrane ammonium transporter [Bisporella sp. PMI_857]|nr:plasma membrane ammonium transporter [Bisporella sp. PMI_857]
MSAKLGEEQYHDDGGLRRANTSFTITPEMFEKLYLSPKSIESGDLRKTFGNPTPVAIIGFLIALTPISIELMGWREANYSLKIHSGATYFFGGLLMILGGVGEFLLGNTFPSVVFLSYGAHFLTFAATYTPYYAAISAYSTDDTQTATPPFLAGFGFYALSMGLLSFVFLVCSLRTNLFFVLVFIGATMGFGFAAGAFWQLAGGNTRIGNRLLVGTGAGFFFACCAGWYLIFAIMLAAMDFPFSLPVVDLSTVIKGAGERKKRGGEV